MSYAYKKIKVMPGKTIDEHRLVMEKHLGRKLLRSEHVHHKDGNKRNNSLDNLEILNSGEHAKKHMTGVKLSEETKKKIGTSLKGQIVGERSSAAILKDMEVSEIKALLKKGILSQKEIADLFNVNRRTISGINVGRIWSHIPWPEF